MKGSISEFELGVLRTRMLDAARAKARRGELRLSVPICGVVTEVVKSVKIERGWPTPALRET